MSVFETKEDYLQYRAKIIKVDNLHEIEGCDFIQYTNVSGVNVVVSKETKIGQTMVYFPTECAINKEFLSVNNLFSSSKLNEDTTVNGYIHKSGRVRAVLLKGIVSRAFLLPVKCFTNWNKKLIISDFEGNIGTEFDTLGGKSFVTKYIPLKKNNKVSYKPRRKFLKYLFGFKAFRKVFFYLKGIDDGPYCGVQKSGKFTNKEIDYTLSHLVPHVNTGFLEGSSGSDTDIHISKKLHGTSCISAYLPFCKNRGTLKEKLKKFLGIEPEYTYEYIGSSKKEVRNIGIHEQPDTVWGKALNNIHGSLKEGMSIYSELVGYDGTTFIQKGYDYGCPLGEFEIYIYRITQLDDKGVVFEYTPEMIESFCQETGNVCVPKVFCGNSGDFFGKNDWLEFLKSYGEMEQNDGMCKNDVPFEGYVLRRDTEGMISLKKIKADKFYLLETKTLDEGELDIDER